MRLPEVAAKAQPLVRSWDTSTKESVGNSVSDLWQGSGMEMLNYSRF